MKKECFDKFRPPQPTDLMDNVSFCSYPWSNKVYCRLWACLRPTDHEGKYEAFSAEAVAIGFGTAVGLLREMWVAGKL